MAMLIHGGKKIGDHRKTVEGHVHSAFIGLGATICLTPSESHVPPELLNWNVSVSTCVLQGEERARKKEGGEGSGRRTSSALCPLPV